MRESKIDKLVSGTLHSGEGIFQDELASSEAVALDIVAPVQCLHAEVETLLILLGHRVAEFGHVTRVPFPLVIGEILQGTGRLVHALVEFP